LRSLERAGTIGIPGWKFDGGPAPRELLRALRSAQPVARAWFRFALAYFGPPRPAYATASASPRTGGMWIVFELDFQKSGLNQTLCMRMKATS
jgi:hypothetical protein